MGLIIAGVDEAGYGPLLGPLCVGMSVLRVDAWQESEGAPNLWTLLKRGVCRKGGDKRGRLAVADSKQLKKSMATLGDSPDAHPLRYLERGVLAFAHASGAGGGGGGQIADDVELLAFLGASPCRHACYAGERVALPLSWDRSQLAIAANSLRGVLTQAGVAALAMRCRVVDEEEVNACIREHGGKAPAVVFAVGEHLLAALKLAENFPGDSVRVVCDRLGGRTSYASLLARLVPGSRVSVLEETPAQSRYSLTLGGQSVVVIFRVEAESAHMSVALASMIAKFSRELAMIRFNRAWTARMPELKPTAGYSKDARRWLSDAAPVLEPADRQRLVRIL